MARIRFSAAKARSRRLSRIMASRLSWPWEIEAA
jgi:hypothetical protein